MNPRKKAIIIGGTIVTLLGLIALASGEAKADDGGDDGDDPCGPDMMRNPMYDEARARVIRSGIKGQQLALALAQIPVCVHKKCPTGFHRDEATGACVKDVPGDDGPKFDPWDPGTDPPSHDCGPGKRWDPVHKECVNDCPEDMFYSPTLQQCLPKPPEEPPADDDDFDVDPWIKDWPEGNGFYQMKDGQILGWGLAGRHDDAITQMMLARELALAAMEFGDMSPTDAVQWGRARSVNGKLTNQLYNAITCAWFNDKAYGTWGYCGDVAINKDRCKASMRNHPGAHGRAIRPLHQHADNLERLKAGLPAARVVAILSPTQKGNGLGNAVQSASPGGKSSLPLFWLPGVNRQRLWESGGTELEFVSEQAHPPAAISDRDITDYSGSTLTKYGCTSGGYDGERS